MAMRTLIRLTLVVVCACFCLFTQVRPGAACTPTVVGNPPETLDYRISRADVILEGVVTALSQSSFDETATIEVVQYLKGSGPAQVTMSNFGSSAVCLASVQARDHLIFYAAGDPAAGLRAYYSSAGQAIASPSDDLIAQITALTGQSPVVLQSATGIAQTLQAPTLAAVFTATGTPTPQPATGLNPTQQAATHMAEFIITETAAAASGVPTAAPAARPAAVDAGVLIGVGVVAGLILSGALFGWALTRRRKSNGP
jgi:hypothetical protein